MRTIDTVKKLYMIMGVELCYELELSTPTLLRLINGQKLTVPLKTLDTLDRLLDKLRQEPSSADPGLFLPVHTDAELKYAAMSKGYTPNAESHEWVIYKDKPRFSLMTKKWQTNNPSYQVTLSAHTIPRDRQGYEGALFERNHIGIWERVLDPEVDGISKQVKWK